MKHFILLLLASTLIACSHHPSVLPLVSEAKESRGLNLVEDSGFDKFFINSHIDLARYQTVRFKPLSLNTLIIDKKRLTSENRSWAFSEQEKNQIIQQFQTKAIATFDETTPATPTKNAKNGVLEWQFTLVKFTPSAAKDSSKTRGAGNVILTRNVGHLTMNASAIDAETGALIAYLEDEQEVGDTIHLKINDRVNNLHYLNIETQAWLKKLHATLSSLKKN